MSTNRANSMPGTADPTRSAAPAAADASGLDLASLGEGLPRPRRRRRRSAWPVLMLLVVLGGAGYGGWRWWQLRGRVTKVERSTAVVRRGDLPITITEGGSLKALKSEVIKCEVEGVTTIITLVPEGVRITDEDVKNGKVLVELDSANLRERLTQQEITFANAEATYTAAKEAHEIQKSEGESSIKNGELNVKFGRMDLEHYVGQVLCTGALAGKVDLLKLADRLFEDARDERRGVEAEVAKAVKEVEAALAAPAEDKPGPPPRTGSDLEKPKRQPERLVTVSEPERADRLGGDARQTKRKLDADIELAIERFKRAADELIWTARLEKKGFVSHNELDADQLALKSSLIDLQQALSARELFLRYQFPKKAEEFLSIYIERGKELERVNARARAAIAQSEAKLKSNEATFRVQKNTLEKFQKQVEKCIMRATKPGLVVYATTGGHWRSRGELIEEGSTVRERQEIIKLPDISSLAVDVKVHESVVDKVKVGLPANIRIDAFGKMRLMGKVTKVGVLPDSSSSWLNPDLKQYLTDVSIDGVHAGLKPGMSAEVEILVGARKDVLQIPVQAVAARAGKSVVYLLHQGGEEEREVVLGESNDKFVEVVSGLAEGDEVLLEAPQAVAGEGEEAKKDEDKEAVGPPRPPGPGAERAVRPKGGPGKQPGTARPARPMPGGSGRDPSKRPRRPRPPGGAGKGPVS